MAGYDPRDPTAAQVPVPDYTAALTGQIQGLRIGVPSSYFFDVPELDPEVKAAVLEGIEVLEQAGAVVREVTHPARRRRQEGDRPDLGQRGLRLSQARPAHALGALRPLHAHPARARGAVQRPRLRPGAARALVLQEGRRGAMADVDVLVTPTSPRRPRRASEIDMQRRLLGPSFTGMWNLIGLPALALPCGFSSTGLPLSMQIVGKPFDEATVLRVGDAYQQRRRLALQVPPIAVAVRMTELPLTITEAAAALRAGELTSVELTGRCSNAPTGWTPNWASICSAWTPRRSQEAAQADADFAAGVDRGPLQGIPLGIKDIIATDERADHGAEPGARPRPGASRATRRS